MTTSTYLEVKQQLKALLTAEFAADAGVSVTWSWDPSLRDRAVFLSRPFFIDESDRDRSSIDFEFVSIRAGRQPRQETYIVPVTVAAYLDSMASDAAQTADETVWPMATAVEDLVAGNPNLGLSSIHFARLAGIEREQYPRADNGAPVGWVVVLVMSIEVTARLN